MTTTADADPNVLPFTSDDYRTAAWRPRVDQCLGDRWLPRSWLHHEPRKPACADWMFWREADGLHAERLADGATCLADDMPDLLDSVIGDWEAAAAQRADKARQSGLRSLPDWLTR